MITTPRLIFINRTYGLGDASGQLLSELAPALAVRGHNVTVITSRPTNSALLRLETAREVTIVRVDGAGTAAPRKRLARLADFMTFLIGVRRELSNRVRPGDMVIAMTNPPLLDLLVYTITYLYEARSYHWIQSIFPEAVIAASSNPLVKAAGYLLRPFRNLAWRKSTGCVTLSHDMATALSAFGVKAGSTALIPNWAPSGLSPLPASTADQLRQDWDLKGKFVVAYVGRMERSHGLDLVLQVAAALIASSEIALVLVGYGPARPALEQTARARGLRNVHFHSPLLPTQLAEMLALADVHLVTLAVSCKDFVFPEMLDAITAAGRPVVFVGPPYCDPARIVVADGFGLAFGGEQIEAVATALRELRDDPARLSSLAAAATGAHQQAGGLRAAVMAWEKFLGIKPLAAKIAVRPRSLDA